MLINSLGEVFMFTLHKLYVTDLLLKILDSKDQPIENYYKRSTAKKEKTDVDA